MDISTSISNFTLEINIGVNLSLTHLSGSGCPFGRILP